MNTISYNTFFTTTIGFLFGANMYDLWKSYSDIQIVPTMDGYRKLSEQLMRIDSGCDVNVSVKEIDDAFDEAKHLLENEIEQHPTATTEQKDSQKQYITNKISSLKSQFIAILIKEKII